MRALLALALAGCITTAAADVPDERAPIRVLIAVDGGAAPPTKYGVQLGPSATLEVCRRDAAGRWTALDDNWPRCLDAIVNSVREMMRVLDEGRRRWR